MYDFSRSKSGRVVVECKMCSHIERVNEFDDRNGSRRTQAAQAMPNHTRTERQRVGGYADAQGPRVVGLKSDYDNSVGNTGQRLLPVELGRSRKWECSVHEGAGG
jgi:hypothetical protein